MKYLKIIILSIAACMLLCACPDKDGHYSITIVNKSEKTILCQPQIIKIGEEYEQYDCQRVNRIINKDSTYEFEKIRHSWEQELDGYYIQLLLMDAETFDQYISAPCDTIRKYVPVLHTYRLTLEDLERMNWTVVYSPEE
ncbi:MAG: hypothetical protein H6544_02305 [Prevotellaceae bacterium]|nr:hypothetical protein [Prevotellaceae bacterium]